MKTLNKQKAGIIILGVFLTCNVATAQSNKTERAAEQVVQAAETLKGLFGKKKQNQPQSAVQGIGQEHKNGGTRVFKAGSISANVKYIECDDMEPFNKGAALIKKGQEYALINYEGNFIVPFGKFSAIASEQSDAIVNTNLIGSGFYYATYRNQSNMIKRCFINSLGKIVYEIGNESPFEFFLSKDRKFLVYIQSNLNSFNNKEWIMHITGYNGQKYKVSYVKSIYNDIKAEYLADSVVTYRMEVNKSYLHGFKDLKNNIISSPKYEYISHFNDGMAVIGKTNDLGEMRYGFVNKKGKVVLEPTFKSKPSSFEAGISIVSSNEGPGFVNKTGKIFATGQNRLFSDPYRKNGYVFSKSSVVDTTGKISTIEDFFAKRGILIPIIQHNITRIKPEGFNDASSPQQLHLNLTIGKSALNYPAAFDFNDQILIYHLHNDNDPFVKDDVSGLIYYQWMSEDRKQKVEGYINTHGEFVIVKKPTRNAGF